jgi:hydroxypyruvate isomerase
MIQRRDFVKSTLGLAGAAFAGNAMAGNAPSQSQTLAKNQFKLQYAPHFGMFANSAGKDLIDQLKFMADNGFTAIEDNGMMGRPVEEQEKIAKEMARLNMKMGVFVVDKGGMDKTHWRPVSRNLLIFFWLVAKKQLRLPSGSIPR